MNAAAGSPAYEQKGEILSSGRSPMAHLLHALNQPLTGLQCSLELALTGSRTPEQYIRTLREGLQLTERMRALVEALRELADMEQQAAEQYEVVGLETLLRETVDDLLPVAEEREIRIEFQSDAQLPVWAGRRRLAAVVFRFLESALSLAAMQSVFRVTTKSEGKDACVEVLWTDAASAPDHSPFSPPELGLLIARAGWSKAGAVWTSEQTGGIQNITIRLPLSSKTRPLQPVNTEI